MQFKTVICGGTFDLLHEGHKAFLQFAFKNGEHVVIGITSDLYTQKNKSIVIQPFVLRKKRLKEFLEKNNLLERAELITIDDVYGPTLTSNFESSAIAVTPHTQTGAMVINSERKRQGLSQLPVLIAPLIREDDITLSSSAIRQSMIDPNGKSYINSAWLIHDHILPEALRPKVAKIFGTLVTEISENLQSIDPLQTVTVGDVTTKLLHDHEMIPKISVVDFKIERQQIDINFHRVSFRGERMITVINHAGEITAHLWQIILDLVTHIKNLENTVLVINGEEDLAVLPFILALPLGYKVLYGQPHEGLVVVEVTYGSKEKARLLLEQFQAKTTRGY